MGNTANLLKVLDQDSQEVSQVLSAITSIAELTNSMTNVVKQTCSSAQALIQASDAIDVQMVERESMIKKIQSPPMDQVLTDGLR